MRHLPRIKVMGRRRGGGRRHEGRRGGGGGGSSGRRAAAATGRRRRRRRRGGTAGGGERPGAGPHSQRQHGLRRPPPAHPHPAGRPPALQGGDAAPGRQLHRAPGQRAAAAAAAAGRGSGRCPALPAALPAVLPAAGRRGPAAHLHLLPQRPAAAAPRRRETAVRSGLERTLSQLRISRRPRTDCTTAAGNVAALLLWVYLQ